MYENKTNTQKPIHDWKQKRKPFIHVWEQKRNYALMLKSKTKTKYNVNLSSKVFENTKYYIPTTNTKQSSTPVLNFLFRSFCFRVICLNVRLAMIQWNNTKLINSATARTMYKLSWLAVVVFNTSLFYKGNSDHLTGVRQSSCKSSATHSYQCM